MDVIRIVGIGLIALIIIILLKQYKPEFTIYVSILAGVLILFLVMDKLTRCNYFVKINCRQSINKYKFY